MALDSQLTLFGLDLRKIPQFWRAGWRELLWASNAYGRRWVDEVVTATFASDLKKQYYQAGRQVTPQNTKAQAYVLPAELVLETRLDLPTSVELDLDSMVALEVRAKSPFPEEDTRYGWQFVRGKDERLTVDLAIVSDKLVTQHLWGKKHELAEAEEIWVMVDEQPVAIQGFGEGTREKRYRDRMKRMMTGLLYSFLMVCALIGVMMLFKYWQIQELEEVYKQTQQDAAEAVELRANLTRHNTLVTGINTLIAGNYNPYPQISKLSEILADDIWLASMNIKGRTMRLDGRAGNAVALMESLSNRSEFSEVISPSAITGGRQGQGERFVFDITLSLNDTSVELKSLESVSSTELEKTPELITIPSDVEGINPVESKMVLEGGAE